MSDSPAPVDPRRTFALVVTVERYDDPTIADLPGLVESADRFVRWLRERGVPEENVIRLGGDRPATSGVLDRVLADDVPGLSGDLLWLFWAGHGAIDREGRRRLLTADANLRHLRSVALDDLLRLYRSTYLAHFDAQLAVVDACQTDVPVGEDSLWPAPLALPPAREQMRDRWQRVWLSTSAGERAAYAGGNALFSEAVLDLLADVDRLVWQPDYDTVRAALDRVVGERVDNAYARQHPITLEHGTEKGEWRSTLVRPSGGPTPFQPGSDETLTAHPVVAAYLRWLSLTHEQVEAQLAGRHVAAPTAELPWTGGLVPDGSTWHARRREVDYLRHRSGDGRPVAELARLAAQPLPTHLTQIGHVDELDLSGREHVPGLSVLDRCWRAVVLGDPGSGKTTLVRALVRRAASAPVDGRWRLPVLCRAVDLAESLASVIDGAVFEADGRVLAEHAIAVGWLATPPADPLSGDRIGRADLGDLARRAFRRGRLLLVVDGLDEVSTRAQRAGLVEMLNRLVHDEGPRYGLPTDGTGNQVLVTSRLVGYYATPLAEQVHQLILAAMPPEAVAETGLFWLRRYSETTGKGPQRARAAEDQFRTAVEAGSSDLISNPYLLVSLLSAIVTGEFARREYRNGPLRRSDLYSFMVDDALARAAERRPGLDTAHALDLQCAVAYAMHRASRTGVFDPAALRACVEEALASHPASDAINVIDAEQALATVHDLGLLTARGQDLFGFLHQTLEEYLAGRWLVRDGSAGTIRPHLDDPRWVEPIRLGLGHLGRADPTALDAVLTDLLTGQDATIACTAMIPSLPELRGVSTAHLELMVAALLDADARTRRSLSEAAAALSLLMSSPITLQDGSRPADVVNHALAATLTRSAPDVVAAAARAVESLGLFTRETATALFHAQYLDGPEHGWATVRALHTMANTTGSSDAAPEAVAEVLAELDDTSQHRLRVISPLSVSRPVPGTDRAPIPGSLTPFREALTDELLTRIGAEPALSRLVLVLYGGTAFRDWRRWTTEQARLQAVTKLATSDTAVRMAAAIRLDTVVEAALNERADEMSLRPQHMTVDSPLTGDILSCLEQDDPVNELGARLLHITQDETDDPVRRGDAAVAWSALRAPELTSVENLPGPVMARAVWRLQRALLVLGDAATQISAGTLVEAFSQTDVETGELARTVRLALSRVSGRAPRFDGWTGWLQFGHEALVAAVCGSGRDREYSVAVLLDTAGRAIASHGPAAIARMLVNARTVVRDFDGYERHWALDPDAPTTGDPFPEALTVISALGSRFAFLRCWLLDRLANELVDRGLGVEALCVALSAAGDDVVSVDRTVSRYARLLPAITDRLGDVSAHDPRLSDALSDLIDSIADPYLAARARLRLARLRGLAVTEQQTTTLAARLEDPLHSLRLLELAHSLGMVPWEPSVASAAWDHITRLEGSPEYEPAHRRWAKLSPALASPGTFRAAFREATEQLDTQTPPPGMMTADLMRPLDARRVPPTIGLPWVILTTATLCMDNLMLVRDTEPADLADWDDLLDPRTRAETALRMRHATRFRPLPAKALPVIDRLIREGDEEIAAELLTHHLLPRNAAAFSDQWRTSRHRRLSDIAALLAIEHGHLDVDAVSALPRLLSDQDERIRLRTGVAIRNRQKAGLPGGRFTAAGIGGHVLARLTEVTVDCRDHGKRANADLYWAMTDIRHDSLPALLAAVDALSPDGRELLLRSIRIVTAETLSQLPRLLSDLTDAEQIQLLRSLDAMAIDTRTTGVHPAIVARAYEPLRAHLSNASDTVASCALELLGRVLPPDRATLDHFADQALRGMDPAVPGTVAIGAALGLGHLLSRFTGPDEDSAKALSTLRMIATGSHRRLAHAGVAGLLQVPGGNEFLDNALTARRLDGEDIMWGKLTHLDDYTDSPRYRAGLRTVSMFVREPAGISGQDQHDHNKLLVDALLDRAETLLDLPPGAQPHSLSEGMDDLADVLGMLVELADAQPAQLRVTVTDQAPALPTKLAALTRSGMWLHREFALRLLVLLGIGDRLSIDALLDSSTDTTLVKQAVLDELGWFDTIEPDGFSQLTTTVTSADLGRSRFAIQILTALLRHRTLSEANHITALRVLRKALERPDANETLWTEQDGRLHATGSFAEHVRANLAELITGQPPAIPGSGIPTVVLRVPDQHGNPLDLVTHTNADTTSSLSNQLSFYETTDRWPANDAFQALDVLMSKAKRAGVPWIAVLAGNNS